MLHEINASIQYFYLENTNPIYFDIPTGFRVKSNNFKKDIDKLYFPKEISDDIGLSINEITFLKQEGCPFRGRKTCIRWVRLFLDKSAGLSDSLHSFYLQDSILNKCHESMKSYD